MTHQVKTQTTSDNGFKFNYSVSTIIYVFLHIRYQFNSFDHGGEDWKTLVIKIDYDLQEIELIAYKYL